MTVRALFFAVLGFSGLFAMQGWGLKELLAPGLLGAGILVGVQKAYFALMEPAPKKAA